MKILGNIIWLIFGGLEAAIGYFTGSVALMITIIGIPLGLQTLKLGVLCLWPFGSKVTSTDSPSGCLAFILDVIWLIFGGIWAALNHLLWGVLLCITIIGIPWGKQHFKMAGLAIAPFGKTISIG
ncbi:MAG: YccF domain-containing protein [Bacteroidales bacterium]|nr:YccF domain-containing protein [Bacteroidales bacterium]